MLRFPTLLLAAILMFSACVKKKGQTSEANKTPDIPESFYSFYQKFHTDSLYQLDHISWPLEGKVWADSLGMIDASWTRETWRMHQLVDFDEGEYLQELKMIGDVMVIEVIRTGLGNFGLERRFALQGSDEWQLIHYTGMHEMKN